MNIKINKEITLDDFIFNLQKLKENGVIDTSYIKIVDLNNYAEYNIKAIEYCNRVIQGSGSLELPIVEIHI